MPVSSQFMVAKVALAIVTVIVILINVFYRRWQIYRKAWLGGIFVYLFLFGFAFIYAEEFKELNQKTQFSNFPSQSLIVRIRQEPKLSAGFIRFNAAVKYTVFKGKISRCTGSLLITLKQLPGKISTLNYGDELLIKSNYTDIKGPANPAELNYKNYLAGQNIYKQAFLNPSQYQLIGVNKGVAVISSALRIRAHLVKKLKKYLTDTAAISVASTLILGYRAELGDDVRAAYAKTGTMHVLSVSGMHVALVYLVISFLLQFLNRSQKTILLKSIISIILIWLYALITGFSPSVCRAALMITFIIGGKTYNRHISTFNILLVSAFILLVYNPLYILDVGFELSYLAVGGLILLQPLIQQCIEPKHFIMRKLWQLLSVSLAAQAITFPISIYYFHQFPVYFLLSNLFIVIPAMLTMYIGLAFLLIPEIDLVTKILGLLLEKSIELMNNGLVWIEDLRFSALDKLWINGSEVIIIYAVVIAFFLWMANRKFVFLQMTAVFILIFLTGFAYKNYQTNNQHTITFLSIAKHAAIVFTYGRKACIITDLTPADKAYRYSIQPFMDSCRVETTNLIRPDQNVVTAELRKQNHLIQFNRELIFVVDSTFRQQRFAAKVKADAVFYHQKSFDFVGSDHPKPGF